MAQTVRCLAFALGLLGGVVLGGGQAESGSPQRVVDRARLAVEAFGDDARFRQLPAYVQNAYGVLIVPDLLAGGFLVGAEYGFGVLLSRDVATGAWSPPAFYELYGGRFGLQFGGKTSDVVYTIMNEAAVLKLMSARLKFGSDASVALGPTGAGVGAGMTAAFGEDIYAFSRSQGLFGGLAFDGSVLVPRHDWNRAYYGRAVTPEEILRARHVDHPGAAALRQALRHFDGLPAGTAARHRAPPEPVGVQDTAPPAAVAEVGAVRVEPLAPLPLLGAGAPAAR